MAKTTGVFVDDARLHPRDNSGGPMGGQLQQGGQFGGGGKVVGGEAADTGPDQDEFKAAPRGSKPMKGY